MADVTARPTYRDRLGARQALLERAVVRITGICRRLHDVRAAYVFVHSLAIQYGCAAT